jgi:hypothetical protein
LIFRDWSREEVESEYAGLILSWEETSPKSPQEMCSCTLSSGIVWF